MCLTPDPRTGGHERSKDAYSFPITGSSWNVLWGQSVLISGSSLRGNIGAAILSRQRSWMLWYNRGWGFVCTSSPDRSAPGSSRESAHGWGPSIEKPCSGRAEYSSLTRFLSSTALHGGFPSGGISSHWQRAWSFTPARSCGNCGCGSRGGTTHSLWSLNWGCWDHPPI